jgi:hypothetical protein
VLAAAAKLWQSDTEGGGKHCPNSEGQRMGGKGREGEGRGREREGRMKWRGAASGSR